MKLSTRFPAFVFGMSETGFSVAKTLINSGIRVVGIDYSSQCAIYSNKFECKILDNPITSSSNLINQIKANISKLNNRPVAFLASDEYVQFYVNNSHFFNENFSHSIANPLLISTLQDKLHQYKIVREIEFLYLERYLLTIIFKKMISKI